jgi:hypothetical protein
MFKKNLCSSVSVNDDNLILSLPDALTPVVWVIPIRNSGDFFFKIEQNNEGLFILQKMGLKEKKPEDIAYYTDAKKAKKAMLLITKAMGREHTSKQIGILSAMVRILKYIILTFIILVALGYFLFQSLPLINQWLGNRLDSPVATVESAPSPDITNNTDAIGVPMSADIFLQQNITPLGLPF